MSYFSSYVTTDTELVNGMENSTYVVHSAKSDKDAKSDKGAKSDKEAQSKSKKNKPKKSKTKATTKATKSSNLCSGGICGNSTKEISLSTSGWGVEDTIVFEGVKEDQVDWEVVYASRKTSIEGSCLSTAMVSQSAPSDSARNVTLDLEDFLSSCSLDSVHLHVIVPRTTRRFCFGGLDNCHPVLCSLGGDQSSFGLSSAPGNNQLLFGLNKDCKIVEPYYWQDYVDIVIGNHTQSKWSNDELYRMDFDGDGLSNIIEYCGE